jgi:nucleotide-binding universal stress UspA family protein
LHRELARLRERGIDADGEVVTGDVVEHVQDLTHEHHVDVVLVSTLPPRLSRWLRMDLVTRLARGLSVPVQQIESPAGPTV